MEVIRRASPNHGPRKSGRVDILLLHYTGMSSAEAALERLCDADSGVSSHYLVGEDGAVHALVGEDRRAWHAGEAYWAGESDINSRSVGIEIHNAGHPGGLPDYPDTQIAAVIALCCDIMSRHPIAAARVLGHSDVAPARKLDPGEKFPWARLAEAGIGLWAEPAQPDRGAALGPGVEGIAVAVLQRELAAFGYRVDVTAFYDGATEQAVTAFQRHWRPALVDGRADGSTRDQLAAIARLGSGG